jgi:hypothetical protein
MTGKRVRRRPWRRVVPIAVAVLVAGTASAWALSGVGPGPGAERGTLTAQQDEDPPTDSASSEPAPPRASPAARGRRAAAAPEAPVRLTLPSGVSVAVRAVSADADGLLEVPDDIDVAGWWRGGSRIGDPFGATLIAAHVDSRVQGLGPYAEVLRTEPGARLVVRSVHQRQTFRVTSLRVVPRDGLSEVTGLFSVSGPRRLVLVTCAGPYDASRGGYLNLAIVTARPSGPPARRT